MKSINSGTGLDIPHSINSGTGLDNPIIW
jgi:hypothetical protein